MTSKEYCALNGDLIVATADIVDASALISGIDPETGEPEYCGESEVDWGSQRTLTRNGKRLFLDVSGYRWTFDQLIARPDDCDDEDWDSMRQELADKVSRRAEVQA